jgi:hypothetical protein
VRRWQDLQSPIARGPHHRVADLAPAVFESPLMMKFMHGEQCCTQNSVA